MKNIEKSLWRLQKQRSGLKKLYNEARKIDEKAIEKISQNDKKRIIRILEIYHETGKTKTEQEILSRANDVKYDYKIFEINIDREILYNRINQRVDMMINQGLIEEVRNLIEKYPNFPTAMQEIGYKEIVEYFENKLTKDEAIEKIKQESRRYAKRQITWFKRIENKTILNGLDNVQNNINIILEVMN